MPRETRDLELNEVTWWGKWVDETVWVSKNCYVMFSKALDEQFYNRAGFLGVERVGPDAIQAVEAEFAKRGRKVPCVMVEEGRAWEKFRSTLSSRGYRVADKMAVMESAAKPKSKPNPDVDVTILASKAKADELQEWTRTYLQAFYGSQGLGRTVSGIVRKVIKDKKASVVLARIGKDPVGCAMMFRSVGGVVGAYCIGTAPEARGKGVATTIIASMRDLAEKEGRRLVLQTLASDSVEGFYLRQGFKVAYTKTLFERRPRAKERDGAPPSGESFGVRINRAARGPENPFKEVFEGFEEVGAVRGLFGAETEQVLSDLRVLMDMESGYLRVDGETGHVRINPEYLRSGHERHLYLDVIHELTHVRQFKEGKELYDRSYRYLERPTEIEAYRVAVEEARRIGMGREEIVEYLKVEWVTEEELQRFVASMNLDAD